VEQPWPAETYTPAPRARREFKLLVGFETEAGDRELVAV
jgi:hypothetical protein